MFSFHMLVLYVFCTVIKAIVLSTLLCCSRIIFQRLFIGSSCKENLKERLGQITSSGFQPSKAQLFISPLFLMLSVQMHNALLPVKPCLDGHERETQQPQQAVKLQSPSAEIFAATSKRTAGHFLPAVFQMQLLELGDEGQCLGTTQATTQTSSVCTSMRWS